MTDLFKLVLGIPVCPSLYHSQLPHTGLFLSFSCLAPVGIWVYSPWTKGRETNIQNRIIKIKQASWFGLFLSPLGCHIYCLFLKPCVLKRITGVPVKFTLNFCFFLDHMMWWIKYQTLTQKTSVQVLPFISGWVSNPGKVLSPLWTSVFLSVKKEWR